jgi:hypothetical protein
MSLGLLVNLPHSIAQSKPTVVGFSLPTLALDGSRFICLYNFLVMDSTDSVGISKFTNYFQSLGSFWVLLACRQDAKPTTNHKIASRMC